MGATIFSASSGRLEIPHVSLENVDEVERAILDHVEGPRSELTSQEVHIYVCTHGARDCRCGDRGRKVYDALVDSVNSARERDPGGPASRVRIGEVGHVGGHKYVVVCHHGLPALIFWTIGSLQTFCTSLRENGERSHGWNTLL